MIRLTDEMKQAIDNALADRAPIVVASVDARGQPWVTFRGSTQVHADDQLAIWVRNPEGNILRHVAANRHVALLYRNPETRLSWQFHGRASLVTDPKLRRLVYDRSPEAERNLDPEVRGQALIIEIDRVIQRGQVIMSPD